MKRRLVAVGLSFCSARHGCLRIPVQGRCLQRINNARDKATGKWTRWPSFSWFGDFKNKLDVFLTIHRKRKVL